jgi:hypothetical protein
MVKKRSVEGLGVTSMTTFSKWRVLVAKLKVGTEPREQECA